MRQVLILVCLGMMSLPSWAGKRISVVQLEETLNAEIAAQKSDAEIAHQIRTIELSERLTDETFERLNRRFAAGSQVSQALLLLADRSSFLDPPPSELPATPQPDAATQQQILEAAQRFALQTLPRLPNLLATRTTLSFDDSPQQAEKGGYPQRAGLHLVGSSKTEVSVRSEQNPSTVSTHASSRAPGGLVTWGEFGSALLIILNDSSHGKISWSHWEQESSRQVAVFHYEVPQTLSHYEIVTPVERVQPGWRSNPSAATGGMVEMAGGATANMRLIRSKPGYQGSLWVDPDNGTIFRLSLIADLRGNSTFDRGAIMVDYGPVKIAGNTFICPVRSLALSSAPSTANAVIEGTTTEWLNENLFTNYHIFSTTSRIITESAAATPSSSPDAETLSSVEQALATAERPAGQTLAQTEPPPAPGAPSTASPIESVQIPRAEPTSVGTPAPAQTNPPVNPTPSEAHAQPVPEDNSATPPRSSPVAESSQIPDSGVTIRVDVNSLLVPVVVRDRKGLAVGGLDKDDFSVLDRGKPRTISGFTVEKSPRVESSQQDLEPGPVSSATALQPAAQNRFIVVLFDDRHLNTSDLAVMQNAATKMMDAPLGAGDYADVLSFMGVNSGITSDRAALKTAILRLKAHPIHQFDDHECPSISPYTAHLIIDVKDDQVFRAAISQAKSCSHLMATGEENVFENMVLLAANRALASGQEDARESLTVIQNVVHAMAKLPGQRTLILISPGFFSDSPETMFFKSEVLNAAAAANVIISALDARGMVIDTTGADHIMSELASGTGGTFFDHSNDLEDGLKSLTVPPDFLYLLELSLNGVKPDGAFHPLQVRVDRQGLSVEFRHGYVLAKPDKGKR